MARCYRASIDTLMLLFDLEGSLQARENDVRERCATASPFDTWNVKFIPFNCWRFDAYVIDDTDTWKSSFLVL